jgi:capsule polysaccharide modification protein KpsS
MHLDPPVTRALLLQGPVGPFFRRLADQLIEHGAQVTKVNFNGGDSLFFRGPEVITYRGKLAAWPERFRAIVADKKIDAIFLFGDCRPIHVPAIAIAKELGIAVWVFEEGYLRPNFITLERGGVNGNSSLPKDAEFYRKATAKLGPAPEPTPIGNAFFHHAVWTTLHSWAVTLTFFLYPHYTHHRTVNSFYQFFCWWRGAIRKAWFNLREKALLRSLANERAGKCFLMPLQVHCDSQLLHSDYPSMEAFIDDIVGKFAETAPKDALLVLKHHPHDLPYKEYGGYLRKLAARLGVADRILYIHGGHLPTLLAHTRGVVTMNSTFGTSALQHRVPVKVMGRAIYDIPGLTSQAPLAEFFTAPGKVDRRLYAKFERWLREVNQVNGSFYKRVRSFGTVSGLEPSTFLALPRLTPSSSLLELETHDHVAP